MKACRRSKEDQGPIPDVHFHNEGEEVQIAQDDIDEKDFELPPPVDDENDTA